MHYNGVDSYVFANGVKIHRFKAKDLEINAAPLCLGNVSIDLSVDNMKRLDYMDMFMTLVLIMMLQLLMVYQTLTSIT